MNHPQKKGLTAMKDQWFGLEAMTITDMNKKRRQQDEKMKQRLIVRTTVDITLLHQDDGHYSKQ